jgi:oligo-1,6-glucosidase
VHDSDELILESQEEIDAFTRTSPDDRLLAILNFAKGAPVFALPTAIEFTGCDLLISNYRVDPVEDIRRLTLRPYEARVYRLL